LISLPGTSEERGRFLASPNSFTKAREQPLLHWCSQLVVLEHPPLAFQFHRGRREAYQKLHLPKPKTSGYSAFGTALLGGPHQSRRCPFVWSSDRNAINLALEANGRRMPGRKGTVRRFLGSVTLTGHLFMAPFRLCRSWLYSTLRWRQVVRVVDPRDHRSRNGCRHSAAKCRLGPRPQ